MRWAARAARAVRALGGGRAQDGQVGGPEGRSAKGLAVSPGLRHVQSCCPGYYKSPAIRSRKKVRLMPPLHGRFRVSSQAPPPATARTPSPPIPVSCIFPPPHRTRPRSAHTPRICCPACLMTRSSITRMATMLSSAGPP